MTRKDDQKWSFFLGYPCRLMRVAASTCDFRRKTMRCVTERTDRFAQEVLEELVGGRLIGGTDGLVEFELAGGGDRRTVVFSVDPEQVPAMKGYSLRVGRCEAPLPSWVSLDEETLVLAVRPDRKD